ncbi:hypothetical protein Bca101_080363 [Brassica carinata]
MAPPTFSPEPPPPPIPPDLLFLRPFAEPPSAISQLSSVSLVGPADLHSLPLPVSSPSVKGASSLVDNASNLWVSKVKSTFQPLTKVASPSISDDGVTSILAPDSISLAPSTMWKDHLVAFFHGDPPSPAKIHADLNPIWGKNGRIMVKKHSKRACFIFIPCPVTRQWALDVGFWHSGNCSFTLSAWHPSINMSPMRLIHAPVWVLFKKVPPELWSIPGFSTLASAVGFPVHSEFKDLKPYSNGIIKLRVVVELGAKKPSTVRVSDKLGNSVLVSVEFLSLPPKCSRCGEFGHLQLRCPLLSSSQTKHFTPQVPSGPNTPPVSPRASLVKDTLAPSPEIVVPVAISTLFGPSSPKILPTGSKDKLGRTSSLPLPSSSSEKIEDASSQGWTLVANRSKIPSPSQAKGPVAKPSAPISNAQFAEEEILIKQAQDILRNRLAAVEAGSLDPSAPFSRKKARKRIRQKLYLFPSTGSDKGSTFVKKHSSPPVAFGLASVGQASSRSVPPNEA